jgi:hypothetical protein
MRAHIRDVIGIDAERLVYAFCVTDRRCFYEHLGEPRFHLRDIVHGGDLELDRDSLAALIEIEVANIVDQIPYRGPVLRGGVRQQPGLYLPSCRRSRAGMLCGAQVSSSRGMSSTRLHGRVL